MDTQRAERHDPPLGQQRCGQNGRELGQAQPVPAKTSAFFQGDVPDEPVRCIGIRGKNQDFLGGCPGVEPRSALSNSALIR